METNNEKWTQEKAHASLLEQVVSLQAENERLKESNLIAAGIAQDKIDSLTQEVERLTDKLKFADKNNELLRGHRDELTAENSKLREERKELIKGLKKCYGWSTFLDYSPEEIQDRKFIESLLSKFEVNDQPEGPTKSQPTEPPE